MSSDVRSSPHHPLTWCPECLLAVRNLRRHRRRQHGQALSGGDDQPSGPRAAPVPLMELNLGPALSHSSYVTVASGASPSPCRSLAWCPDCLLGVRNLRRHRRRQHGQAAADDQSTKSRAAPVPLMEVSVHQSRAPHSPLKVRLVSASDRFADQPLRSRHLSTPSPPAANQPPPEQTWTPPDWFGPVDIRSVPHDEVETEDWLTEPLCSIDLPH